MEKNCNKNILVLGDVMVDIAWVIRATDKRGTSQPHGGCIPQKILESGWKTEMLGGAATVARRIFANDKFEGTVTLAGAWSKATDKRIRELIPEIKTNKNKNKIEFKQLFDLDYDTLKWRIYSSSFEEIKIEHRFDRDFLLKENSKEIKKNINYLESHDFSLIVVDDFNKGMLDHPKIFDLLKKYNNIPFLLRPKRRIDTEVIKKLPWTILMPNRSDFTYLLNVDPLNYKILKKIKKRKDISIHPNLLDYLFKINSCLEKNDGNHTFILIKLDKEGALLFNRKKEEITLFLLAEDNQDPCLLGVGAGDVLSAELAVNRTIELNNLVNCIGEAVKSATAYCFSANTIIHKKIRWYGRIMDFNESKDNKKGICFEKEPTDTLKNIKDLILINDHPSTATKFLDILTGNKKHKLSGSLRFHRAQWYLDGFFTVDKEFGSKIELYLREFENYIAQEDKERKPFVVALYGKIGSGKSSLAKNLATATGCEFIESNAAQWTSFEDLFLICEQIRSVQISGKKFPFVFIDEVDSYINSQKIYGKLLAPVWDNFYTYKGFRRELGPAIYLLAGSSNHWKNNDKLPKNKPRTNEGEDFDKTKLPDLISRFRLKPLQIPSLLSYKNNKKFLSLRPDAVYIAAHHIKCRFPNAKEISLKLFKLLTTYKTKFEARSIVQAINGLDLVEENFKVTLRQYDLDNSIIELYFSITDGEWKNINGKFIEIGW